jgi:hypothetical protein
VRIPVDAASTEALARACGKLRSLRLRLGAGDVRPEGLSRLSLFSQLDRCAARRGARRGLPAAGLSACARRSSGGRSPATRCAGPTPTSLYRPRPLPASLPSLAPGPAPSLSLHAEAFSGRATAVPLALAHLPPGLTRLELKHVEVVDGAEGAVGLGPRGMWGRVGLELKHAEGGRR